MLGLTVTENLNNMGLTEDRHVFLAQKSLGEVQGGHGAQKSQGPGLLLARVVSVLLPKTMPSVFRAAG